MNTLCIYHRSCADGLVSAWAVHRALGASVEYHAAAYSDEGWPDVTGRDVLIVDFSYPRAELEEMARRARSVLVLDHHKSAQEQLAGLQVAVEPWEEWLRLAHQQEHEYPAALFDMNRSGAGITWDYLHPAAPRPRIVTLVEDRDLWRFKYGEETRAFHAVLTSYDMADLQAMLARLDGWHAAEQSASISAGMGSAWQFQEWISALEEGRAILRYHDSLVADVVRGTRRTMRIGGHVVPVACVPGQLASDAGHLLCNTEVSPLDAGGQTGSIPVFSATYYDGADGRRHFSLRSAPSGADVSTIAQGYGGGGHHHAAGFDRPIGWEGE